MCDIIIMEKMWYTEEELNKLSPLYYTAILEKHDIDVKIHNKNIKNGK